MSLINKEVSDFSAKAYHHDEFVDVTKKDILGKWSLFFFYPADFTFVCPTELEDLQNSYEAFQKAGCEIYAVSTDTEFVHKAWHDASESIGKITYPMVADPTHQLAKDFKVYIKDNGLAERGAFIVNPEGRIVAYEVTAGNVGRNAEELLRKVQACQFVHEHGDLVCPARWQPGGRYPQARYGLGRQAIIDFNQPLGLCRAFLCLRHPCIEKTPQDRLRSLWICSSFIAVEALLLPIGNIDAKRRF